MSDFKTRLIQERDELQEKIDKLRVFLSSDKADILSDMEKTLMYCQFTAMVHYEAQLAQRIKLHNL